MAFCFEYKTKQKIGLDVRECTNINRLWCHNQYSWQLYLCKKHVFSICFTRIGENIVSFIYKFTLTFASSTNLLYKNIQELFCLSVLMNTYVCDTLPMSRFLFCFCYFTIFILLTTFSMVPFKNTWWIKFIYLFVETC